MKTKPVRRHRKPRYPTRLEALADRTLLERHLPASWRRNKEMAAVTALLLGINSVVRAGDAKAPISKAAVVAPIFNHGEGRGATGCVSVAPPVFLSEEEAFQVIQEELTKHGVNLAVRSQQWKDVKIAKRTYRLVMGKGEKDLSYEEQRGRLKATETADANSLTVDAVDPAKHVAVEFVSVKNYAEAGGLDTGSYDVVYEGSNSSGMSMSTVSTYDFAETAKYVAGKVARQKREKVFFGAFYDPAAYEELDSRRTPKTKEEWQARWAEMDKRSRAESKRLLRLQVRDFIEWLKGQGVI